MRTPSRLARELLFIPLDTLAGLAGPLPRLFRSHPSAGIAYLRNFVAVREALGRDVAEGYRLLVEDAARRDGEVARDLARSVPDQLARVGAAQRGRYVEILAQVLRSHPRTAPEVAERLAGLLPVMDDPTLLRFLDTGLDLLTTDPGRGSSFLRMESEASIQAMVRPGVSLSSVSRVLSLYAHAHCGEVVRIRGGLGDLGTLSGYAALGFGPPATVDGHGIQLPDHVAIFQDQRDFLVYRTGTALATAFLEFGTFDLELARIPGEWPFRRDQETDLERLYRAFPRRVLARDLFHLIEGARVEACLRRAYPGVARDLDLIRRDLPDLRSDLGSLSPIQQVLELLVRRAWGRDTSFQASVEVRNSLEHLSALIAGLQEGGMGPADSARVLQEAYPRVAALGVSQAPANASGEQGFESFVGGALLRPEARDREARELDDEAWRVREAERIRGVERSFTSVRQALRHRGDGSSYAEMDAWLDAHPAPGGGIVAESDHTRDSESTALPQALIDGIEPEPGNEASFSYAEWDDSIQDYRPDWVHVHEFHLAQGSRAFVDELRARQRPLMLTLRRQFEALRPEEMVLHRGLEDGDVLDMDRVVEAWTERRSGGTPTERLYSRHRRDHRDVAVAFLLDMSSSTNEVVGREGKRILDIEKEALVIIADAVDALGDAFAIYGFSGYGRGQVAFYIAKDFGDLNDDRVRERIGRMTWKMENRDGAAIRHVARKLIHQPARVRLMVLLSDGKPLDCGSDHYFDRYAQEDTRVALREARKAGIHPFCITVDPLARDYLKRMYGDSAYTIIDRVEALPLRLPTIYRRLTR